MTGLRCGLKSLFDGGRSFFARNLDLSASHMALSMARIGFHMCVLVDLIQLFNMRAVSFSANDSWIGDFALPLDIFFVIALILGFNTRLSAIFHYLLFVWIISQNVLDAYHFDRVVNAFAFLFLFAPAPKYLSFDSKLKGVSLPQQLIPTWFFVTFTAAIWQFYFDSLLFKFESVLWTKGIITYFATLPYRTFVSPPQLFESEWLVHFLSYGSFLFELLFPLILLRQTRLPIAVLGTIFHFGIALSCPIPCFGLGICALYLLFFDFKKVLALWQTGASHATPAIKECSPRILWALPVVLFAIQVCLVYVPTFPTEIKRATGIWRHQLYHDSHFTIASPILRFIAHRGEQTFEIPTFKEDCHLVFPESSGRYFCSLCFVVRGDKANEKSINRFVLGWMKKAGMQPEYVEILSHDTKVPLELDFDLNDRMQAEPWKPAGKITFAPTDGNGDKVRIVWNEWFGRRYMGLASSGNQSN